MVKNDAEKIPLLLINYEMRSGIKLFKYIYYLYIHKNAKKIEMDVPKSCTNNTCSLSFIHVPLGYHVIYRNSLNILTSVNFTFSKYYP